MKPLRNFFFPLAATMSPCSAMNALKMTTRQMIKVSLLDEIIVVAFGGLLLRLLRGYKQLVDLIMLASSEIYFDASDAHWRLKMSTTPPLPFYSR